MQRRTLISAAGLGAAILLIYVWNPWQSPDPGSMQRAVATLLFWAAFVVLLALLFVERKNPEGEVEVEPPRFVRFLFGHSSAGLFWLPIRLFVGMAWLSAGINKLTQEGGGWLDGGASLAAYWERAVAIPEAPVRPAIFYDWYRDFIGTLLSGGHEAWFAYVIVFGEIAVGIALVVGALTGIAAFFGIFMNMAFLLAGSVSSGPILLTMGIGLMLAWRVAGYYGVDRYLLPMLGTPWHARVRLSRPHAPESAPA